MVMTVRTFTELMQYQLSKDPIVDVIAMPHKEPITGGAVVCGTYHDGEITIDIYHNGLDVDLSKRAVERLEKEVMITYAHELVHSLQDAEGRFTDEYQALVPNRRAYLFDPIELEAYCRVDIPNELMLFGSSYTLAEYAKLLNEDYNALVYQYIRGYGYPIDNYMEQPNNEN